MRQFPFVLPVLAGMAGLWCACSKSPAVSEPARTYQIGERVDLAPLNYAVFEKQWAAQLGSGNDARLPQTRFLLVRISAANNGKSEVFVPNMTLEDDAGNSYAEVSNGDGVANWIGYLRSIKPADTIQGWVLFDCPLKHYKLKLTNEDGKAAYVELPLSFDNPDGVVDVLPKEGPGGKLSHPK